jgi:hypothetical protein
MSRRKGFLTDVITDVVSLLDAWHYSTGSE